MDAPHLLPVMLATVFVCAHEASRARVGDPRLIMASQAIAALVCLVAASTGSARTAAVALCAAVFGVGILAARSASTQVTVATLAMLMLAASVLAQDVTKYELPIYATFSTAGGGIDALQAVLRAAALLAVANSMSFAEETRILPVVVWGAVIATIFAVRARSNDVPNPYEFVGLLQAFCDLVLLPIALVRLIPGGGTPAQMAAPALAIVAALNLNMSSQVKSAGSFAFPQSVLRINWAQVEKPVLAQQTAIQTNCLGLSNGVYSEYRKCISAQGLKADGNPEAATLEQFAAARAEYCTRTFSADAAALQRCLQAQDDQVCVSSCLAPTVTTVQDMQGCFDHNVLRSKAMADVAENKRLGREDFFGMDPTEAQCYRVHAADTGCSWKLGDGTQDSRCLKGVSPNSLTSAKDFDAYLGNLQKQSQQLVAADNSSARLQAQFDAQTKLRQQQEAARHVY